MSQIMATLMEGLSEEEHEEHMADFRAVIANIELDRLPSMVSSIRKKLDSALRGTRTRNPEGALPDLIRCTVCSPPLFGSYHILFSLEFCDRVRWILKVPATGYPGGFDDKNARALKSEAMTMRLLKRDTQIPVPEVFSFDTSFDNEIKSPFILMEFIQGIPLYKCWFDKSCTKDVLEQRREQALRGVAKAVLQLNRYKFDQGGAPVFDHDGNIEIGPLRTADMPAMLKRLNNDEDDQSPIFCELGPFKDQKSQLLCMLDRLEPSPDAYCQGLNKLLRLFIEWVPEEYSAGAPAFVLTHPDLDIQNVLVSEEGTLRGLIDWDGVAAVPKCIGNERYPSWLIRDWDPMKYGLRDLEEDVEPGQNSEAGGYNESKETIKGAQNSMLEEKPEAEGDLRLEGTVKKSFWSFWLNFLSWLELFAWLRVILWFEQKETKKPAEGGELGKEFETERDLVAEATVKPHQDAEAAKEVEPIDESLSGKVMADEEDILENTPKELASYRVMYQEIIAASAEQESNLLDINYKQSIIASSRLTRNALMVQNLAIAATDPVCMTDITLKIFDEISKVDQAIRRQRSPCSSEETTESGQKDEFDSADDISEDLYAYEICCALAEGHLDDKRLERLKVGFAKFCS